MMSTLIKDLIPDNDEATAKITKYLIFRCHSYKWGLRGLTIV